MECIKFLDLLTDKLQIKIDGNSKKTNIYSSLLGLFVLLGLIIYTLLRSLDILNKTSMYIIENNTFKNYNDLLIHTKKPFALIVTDNLGYEFDNADRIYEIKAKYFDYYPKNKSQDQNVKMIDLKNTTCKDLYSDGDNDDIKNLYIFQNIKCFDTKQYNISIFGSENQPVSPHSSLHFYLNMCTNSTVKNDCLPREEIQKKMAAVKLTIYFSNKQLDKKSKNPFFDFVMQ